MNFGIIIDRVFEDHEPPRGHPERPDRIRAILEALDTWGESPALKRFPVTSVDETLLGRIHTPGHLERMRRTAGRSFDQLDPDTYTSAESYRVALLAAGSVVDLTRRLIEGEIESGFALIRPPGHHAESNRAMGFCLFNNLALAAEYATSRSRIGRVAVVDFDVHHGNGTQEIFYNRTDVLYLSTHQYPFYPGTGSWGEVGRGEGRGFTVNFPIMAGMGNSFYATLFVDLVVPIVQQFSPDLILVSAGFDAHRTDPLAGMMLDEVGFSNLVHQLNTLAAKVCEGRILYVLEGGYNLQALSRSVLATISTTLQQSGPEIVPDSSLAYGSYRERAEEHYSSYWPLGR